jgi:asparagine synthase (glutamine-hydrolysing)
MLRRLIPTPVLLHALRPARRLWQRMPEFVERALRSLPIRERLQRFEEAYALFTTAERQTLTGRSDDGQALQDIAYWVDWNGGVVREPVEDMMRVDARTCLPDDWLLYGDKVSMAFSLETRVPILDVEVVRFIESLPRPYRVRLAKRKVVHKMMARRYLPPSIVNRQKQGFPTPFVSWSRGPLRKHVTELLVEELPRDGLVQRDAIERLLHDHFNRSRDVGRQIYALFTLANWRRQFAV